MTRLLTLACALSVLAVAFAFSSVAGDRVSFVGRDSGLFTMAAAITAPVPRG